MNLLDLWRSLTRPPELSPAARLNLEFRCTACGAAYTRPVRRMYVDLAVSRRNQRQAGPGQRDEFHIPEVIVCPVCQAADAYELAPSVFGQVTGALMRSALGAHDPDAPIQFLNRYGSERQGSGSGDQGTEELTQSLPEGTLSCKRQPAPPARPTRRPEGTARRRPASRKRKKR
jgi:hypothetical protein